MWHLLSDLFQGAIRTLGFFTKEIVGVLRQPRLIASLVLGPFLILLLFGLGFRGQHPEFRTTLVVPNEPSISDDPRVYQQAFTGVFKLQQVTRDEDRARSDLQADRADVLIVIPAAEVPALPRPRRDPGVSGDLERRLHRAWERVSGRR